jgi:cytidyltransferase-like protein
MRVTVVSLYANPIHCGHLDYIEAAVKMGNYVIAIVNNDHQVKLKGSQPFMNQEERLRIVGSIKVFVLNIINFKTMYSLKE